MLMIIIINHLENNHDNGFDNHLFLKDLNLNLRRREVAIEVETTLSDGDTFCAPAHHHNHNEDEVVVARMRIGMKLFGNASFLLFCQKSSS